jgi:phosphoglucomutase
MFHPLARGWLIKIFYQLTYSIFYKVFDKWRITPCMQIFRYTMVFHTPAYIGQPVVSRSCGGSSNKPVDRLYYLLMAVTNEVKATLDRMILSASGWRGVFAVSGNEEDRTEGISPAHRIISAAAALVFAEYLRNSARGNVPLVLVGSDTRPTGKAVAEAMIPVLAALGCEVRYAGVTAAPEIMAWARKCGASGAAVGFIFISASHNPIGHNGLKFGLADGGVLAPDETVKLIGAFRSLFDQEDCIAEIENKIAGADPEALRKIYAACADAKAEACKAYYDFTAEILWGPNPALADALKAGLKERPVGIVCDFNGSARTVSIDRDFLTGMGIRFEAVNDKPGEIAHRIVPEG